MSGRTKNYETLAVRREGAVMLVAIGAPPMNLLGPPLVRATTWSRNPVAASA
jgi:hypothetical protein